MFSYVQGTIFMNQEGYKKVGPTVELHILVSFCFLEFEKKGK